MPPRIAIAADIMHVMGGAERVTLALSQLYPDAPIYTPLYNSSALDEFFGGKKIVTSYLQKWRWLPIKATYTFLPLAVESFNFNDFDIVISSSNSYIKNIITRPSTIHISYVHSPMRYIWDAAHTYATSQHLPWPLNSWVANGLHKIRLWDAISVSRVDHYVANSKYVRERIRKYYRKDATVIYPPVDVTRITPEKENDGYFLVIARLSKYKLVDLAVKACNELQLPLVVIGTGDELDNLRKLAGPTVKILGWMSDADKYRYLQRARALIFPCEEDFGIVPVEAMAAGKPVIAYRKGGLLETVVEDETGVFFDETTTESLKSGIQRFMEIEKSFDFMKIRERAEIFSAEKFAANISQLVQSAWNGKQ
jgi:glycosyltransferase involved in cell wall biosynthesis